MPENHAQPIRSRDAEAQHGNAPNGARDAPNSTGQIRSQDGTNKVQGLQGVFTLVASCGVSAHGLAQRAHTERVQCASLIRAALHPSQRKVVHTPGLRPWT